MTPQQALLLLDQALEPLERSRAWHATHVQALRTIESALKELEQLRPQQAEPAVSLDATET